MVMIINARELDPARVKKITSDDVIPNLVIKAFHNLLQARVAKNLFGQM